MLNKSVSGNESVSVRDRNWRAEMIGSNKFPPEWCQCHLYRAFSLPCFCVHLIHLARGSYALFCAFIFFLGHAHFTHVGSNNLTGLHGQFKIRFWARISVGRSRKTIPFRPIALLYTDEFPTQTTTPSCTNIWVVTSAIVYWQHILTGRKSLFILEVYKKGIYIF